MFEIYFGKDEGLFDQHFLFLLVALGKKAAQQSADVLKVFLIFAELVLKNKQLYNFCYWLGLQIFVCQCDKDLKLIDWGHFFFILILHLFWLSCAQGQKIGQIFFRFDHLKQREERMFAVDVGKINIFLMQFFHNFKGHFFIVFFKLQLNVFSLPSNVFVLNF